MKFFIHFTIVFFTSINLIGNLIYCQNTSIEFPYKKYTIEDGLPSNTVHCGIQDSNGYMWFCTTNGICRFDGKDFELIDLNKYGINENEFVYGFVDSKNNKLWFCDASMNFINYDYKKFNNISISDTINKRFGTKKHLFSNNDFWVLKNNQIHSLSGFKYKINIDSIWFVKKLNNNKIIINSNIYESRNNELLFIDSIPYQFNKIFEIENDLIIRESKNYIITYNIVSKKYSKSINIESGSNLIYNINNNSIWFTDLKKGINIYNVNTNRNMRSFINEKILNIFNDNTGNIWLYTINNSIILLNYSSIANSYHDLNESYNSIIKTTENAVYTLDSRSNLLKFDRISNKIISKLPPYIDPLKINIACDESWIFLSSSLWIYKYNLSNGKKEMIYNIGCKSLNANNSIFITGLDEVTIIDKNNNKNAIEYFRNKSNINRKLCLKNDSILIYNMDNKIYELNIYYPNRAHKYITQIYNNSEIKYENNKYYFATRDKGVILFINNKQYSISEKDGLINNFVNTTYIENDSVFWVGTQNGASRIYHNNGTVKTIKNYSVENGLSSNIVNKITIANECVYFATNKGITIFSNSFTKSNSKDIIKLNYVINNTSDSFFSNTFKSGELIRIKLNPIYFNTNYFLKYTYKIISNNKAITETTTDPNIYLSNLKYGKYTIEIYASNRVGIKSNIVSIPIEILPPFYATWWFISSIIIFVLILLFIGFYVYSDRLRTKNKLNKLQGQSLQLQMNPHFIFNSMNSINNFIYSNDANKANIYLSKIATLIRKSLNYVDNSTISLSEELENIKNYLEIEKMRFEDKMNYSINVDESINEEDTLIPPFIFQPLVENAIIHGIEKYKDGGQISINIRLDNNKLNINIKNTGNLTTIENVINNSKHQSKGIAIVEQRAKIFNDDTNQCLFQNENIENGNHISYDAILILIHKTSN
jgi:ligand-binding sensor domain-containing protein